MRTVYVVRHAIAADRESWSGSDALRPLIDAGLGQAERLASTLRTVGIRRVLSSPAVRCRQTVLPLAAAVGLTVEDAPELAEGNTAETSLRMLAGIDTAAVAGCTHGDVLEDLVAMLASQGVFPEGRARVKKASTWRLRVEGARIVDATYLPPP